MSEDGAPAAASPLQQVARLMDGYLTTQLLYVAAKLGIADALADGPLDAEALARAVGAQPDALRRVLRGLAAEGVLDECPDGRFGLTALGACLRGDVPGSLRGAISARGDVYYGAAAGLLDAVQHGGAAFERVHGLGFFEYLTQRPELGAAFQDSMADRSRQEAADVVAAYDSGGFEQLVDVGGGHGILLEAILRAAPRSCGVLLDRPPVVERARERLEAAGLAGRCTFVPGDFFAAVPPGGDAYLLSRVIHDWDDDAAIRILANCRAAMPGRGTLLLVEAVLPERAREQPAAIRMDLHMLTLLHGRERTGAEYERLLGAVGFRLRRVVPTRSAAGISIIEAGPAAPPEHGESGT
jgi:O-methyltransferase/methyltransferase family protein